jgi:hypothetical protein
VALGGLERFARPTARRRVAPDAVCEICAAAIGDAHPHVADLQRRSLCCACDGCGRLFAQPGAARGRFRTVPARVLYDPGLALAAPEWTALGMPVQLAFLFHSSSAKAWMATFPGAAGATEAEVAPEALGALSARTALVARAEPDVEALLVHGPRGAHRLECLLVPITTCYDLVARVRRRWKGFDGGDEVRREIEAAMAALRARARPIDGPERRGAR